MFGDVVLCRFPFTSGAAAKVRPALILFDFSQDAVICRITSVSHGGALEVPISDWQSAGLLKPSFARIDRIVTAEKSIFLRQLGALSPADQTAIRNLWNQNMRL